MTATTDNLPMLLRREQALGVTGLDRRDVSKAVDAGVIQPVYLVWEVRAKTGKALFSHLTQEKAEAAAFKNPGAKAVPMGRAYYRRADVLALANGKSPSAD
jgi:hypothetical protein